MRALFTARMRRLSSNLLFCAIAAMASQLFLNTAVGQSTFGSFTGTVKDPTGAAVPTCVVSLVNKGTSVKRDAVTGADGGYLFVNVEPGMYDLTFQAPGFQKSTVTGFELLARQAARVDTSLTLRPSRNPSR